MRIAVVQRQSLLRALFRATARHNGTVASGSAPGNNGATRNEESCQKASPPETDAGLLVDTGRAETSALRNEVNDGQE